MQCQRYSDELESVWDSFIHSSAWNSTFLHTRKFLSYHGERFEDVSLLVRDEDGRVIAVFPAAVHSVKKDTVVSHPGATFGGLVAGKSCRGEACISVLSKIAGLYQQMGFNHLVYKTVPHIYHQTPFQDDLYALFRLGFSRTRCDISATIAAASRAQVTKGRKYEINKAKKHGVEIVFGVDFLATIHHLITENLWVSHQAKPVHSAAELLLLHTRFPESIRFVAARLDTEVVAGLVMFNFRGVAHTQYIASNVSGRESGALDYLIEHAVNEAIAEGFCYFDFGISNENEGLVLNENLYRYKRTFGAGSVIHEFYDLDLRGL